MKWFANLFAHGPASGCWRGYYEQHGDSFPIELSLKHRGAKIAGRMIDCEPNHSQPLRKLLVDSGMAAEGIEQYIEGVKSQFPDTPNGEIEFCSSLPTTSQIAGEIKSLSISFSKRYEGHQEIEYRLNGLSLYQSAQCAIVKYQGEISVDFRAILGNWSIPAPEESGSKVNGRFYLERSIAG